MTDFSPSKGMGVLSPLTNIENEYLGITNEIIVYKETKAGVGSTRGRTSSPFEANQHLDQVNIKDKMIQTK